MRANTDRSTRLAFDKIADDYSTGRSDVDNSTVDRLVELAGWVPGDCILEIGAGTGQLTIPLAQRGLVVTAIEPGPAMAIELRRRTQHFERVDVVNTFYEEFVAGGRVSGVVAANSFHWLDPRTAYDRVASQLVDGGTLALMWNFPVAADDGVQRVLNEGAWTAPLQDLRREVASETTVLDRSLAEGRRELLESDHFGAPMWEMTTVEERWSLERLTRFCASLASTTGYAELIAERLSGIELHEPIHMLNRVYVLVAHRA
ncbi:MAG: methyltransferase domain-containing protein [Actinomycetota bacterium]